jgi:hypothetical protein
MVVLKVSWCGNITCQAVLQHDFPEAVVTVERVRVEPSTTSRDL